MSKLAALRALKNNKHVYNGGLNLMWFAIGASTVGAATHIIVKKKLEEKYELETEVMAARYRKEVSDLKKRVEELEEVAAPDVTIVNQNPEAVMEDLEKFNKQVSSYVNYAQQYAPEDVEGEKVPVEEEAKDEEESEDIPPYPITVTQLNDEDFEYFIPASVKYFPETDSFIEVNDDMETLFFRDGDDERFGPAKLNFGYGNDDPNRVIIRNEEAGIHYEIERIYDIHHQDWCEQHKYYDSSAE